jgi:hypothetical protein
MSSMSPSVSPTDQAALKRRAIPPRASRETPNRRLPACTRWLARLVAGEAAVTLMTGTCSASNAKAKREPGWTLRYPTWREGLVASYSSEGNDAEPARSIAARRSARTGARTAPRPRPLRKNAQPGSVPPPMPAALR